MKMFLTRLGFGSTFVITGDASQTDLPGGASSLGAVRHILDGIDDIAFVELKGSDVVRQNLGGEDRGGLRGCGDPTGRDGSACMSLQVAVNDEVGQESSPKRRSPGLWRV